MGKIVNGVASEFEFPDIPVVNGRYANYTNENDSTSTKDKIIFNQQQEIDRLNKIIDELEKYIINHYYIDDWEEEVVSQKDLLNILQELKEEGK